MCGDDGAVVAVECDVGAGVSWSGGDELCKAENVWILTDEVFDDGAVFEVLEKASYELLQNLGGVVGLELTVGDHLVVLGLGDDLDGGVVGVGGWVGWTAGSGLRG